MKLNRYLSLLAALFLSGCAYQQPSTIFNSVAQDEGSIKAKITNAAYRNNWKVCNLHPNMLQLYKDFNKYQISLIAKYSELDHTYDLSIDPNLTSLVDKSGRVHPKANKILTQTNNLIKRSSGQAVNNDIPNCTDATKVKTFKGNMFSRTRTCSQLFWKSHEQKIPNDKKFDVFVMDNDQIPDAFLQSMEERTAESLLGLDKLSTSSSSYVIEITLKNFYQKTSGAAVDFVTGQGS